ncbi:MAG: LON peptidase substrate-binding domain-containing protein, partial [Oscillospiraceae bacterium]|nr:LON peptidase substrate-binding domain-containing protein [Oscillospiraceae bacterium]
MEEVKHEDHPVVDVKQNRVSVPMIALRGPSIFPQMLLTLDIERRVSVAALNNANRFERTVFIAAQRDPLVDIPEEKDLYRIGVVCRIRQLLQQPGASVCRVMLEGLYRASAEEMHLDPKGYTAVLVPLEDLPERVSETRKEALIRTSVSLYQEYLQLSGEFNPDQLLTLFSNSTPSYISDFLAQNVMLTPFEKQHLLEELHPCKRLMDINRYLGHELDIMNIEKELNDAAIESMNRGQREYYLREELKAIQSELGEDGADELDEYQKKIDALPVSDEVKTKLRKELSHLSKQPFGSSEGAVIRTYLDTCLELPWGKYTKETVDIKKARSILDRDHYGLEKVKERILEYLAVKQLSPEIKGGLLCLSGAPGTGKTSIAMSVAKATNRKLVRISLGGVHDEADIRGHRKTYIGSMPGRIINAIVQAGSS